MTRVSCCWTIGRKNSQPCRTYGSNRSKLNPRSLPDGWLPGDGPGRGDGLGRGDDGREVPGPPATGGRVVAPEAGGRAALLVAPRDAVDDEGDAVGAEVAASKKSYPE